ncbi:hypothetical protein Pmani_020765 [Petrolisthes manimaculis]|uniref:Uncharacterized protein n=1 Tax=Petrolisthes manimaculis TaxID=1843537 RepID=A0AAE1U3Y5_9EUCA|nr:hypothetical protein Pmani_020765 [Petrolisthes manimaculis]
MGIRGDVVSQVFPSPTTTRAGTHILKCDVSIIDIGSPGKENRLSWCSPEKYSPRHPPPPRPAGTHTAGGGGVLVVSVPNREKCPHNSRSWPGMKHICLTYFF